MSKAKASLGVIIATVVTVMTLFFFPYTPKKAVRTCQVIRQDLYITEMLEGVVGYMNEQPLISLTDGQVSHVYVKPGDAVREGQLLFLLDMEMEMHSLAAVEQELYFRKEFTMNNTYGEALSYAAGDQLAQLHSMRQTLQSSIAVKQVRAATDSIVQSVYISEGDYVTAQSVLGVTRGEGIGITATRTYSSRREPVAGTSALLLTNRGELLGNAVLHELTAPTATADLHTVQQMLFSPVSLMSNSLKPGDRLMIQAILEIFPDAALVPVEAVGSGNKLWIVEGDEVSCVAVDAQNRNDAFVAVPDELIGATVVLYPDEADLTRRSRVKVIAE